MHKCINIINNTDIDYGKDVDIAMPMYNLIEYSNNYSKTSGRLRQHCKNEPKGNLANSESFKSKGKITGTTPAGGNTKDVRIIVPLKYLSNKEQLTRANINQIHKHKHKIDI